MASRRDRSQIGEIKAIVRLGLFAFKCLLVVAVGRIWHLLWSVFLVGKLSPLLFFAAIGKRAPSASLYRITAYAMIKTKAKNF